MDIKKEEYEKCKEVFELYEKYLSGLESEISARRASEKIKSQEKIKAKLEDKIDLLALAMNEVNPKFDLENKKNIKVKEELQKLLFEYEDKLYSVANFYDKQIEEKLIEQVKLRSELIGEIANSEYLRLVYEEQLKNKENDPALNVLKSKLEALN